MKNKATLFFALLALAFGAAQAVPVSRSDAKLAAKAWVGRGGLLGAEIGPRVADVSEFATTNGATFYSVKMTGGGTLFMSSDTDYAPVIAFTSSGEDFSSIDRKSPLWALLNRDLSLKLSAAKAAANSSPAVKAAAFAASNARLWRELVAEGGKVQPSFADPIKTGNPGDLRVGPLLKTKWSQSTAKGGVACWNYYTPNGPNPDAFVAGDAKNAVCGCVATAMAQIMRYHNYPTQPLEPLSRECFWTEASSMKLTTQGGVYEWDKMTYDPSNAASLSTESCMAIGKLASDAGISVYMQYSRDASGAFAFDISGATKNYWQYGSAVFFHPESMDEVTLANASRNALYSNFDAGLPVFMGIPGHQIVADGYGWNNETEYVHLNMGWAGQCDFWYNLPDMTAAGAAYSAVDDLVYNVLPDGSGRSAVVSGRTLDEDGNAVAESVVELWSSGLLVTQVVSSAQGVWGVAVDAGSYNLIAYSKDGLMIGELPAVTVKAAGTTDITWNSLRTVPTVRSAVNIGNSWGNDITISNPSVRIGEDIYTSLDKAFAAAADMTDPVVEILSTTELKESVSIASGCTVVLADSALPGTQVLRKDGATITVAAGGTLALSGVVFAAADATAVTVAAGGCLVVGSGVDFGVGDKYAAVVTADANGLIVTGIPASGFSLDCAAAGNLGQTFGSLEGLSVEDAATAAAKVVNFKDDSGEIRGAAEGETSPFALKWAEMPVPFDECSCYYVDGDGVVNTSAKIDRIITRYFSDVESGKVAAGTPITLRKSGELTVSVVVEKDITLVGEGGVRLKVAPKEKNAAAFRVNGGRLTVKGVGFDGYTGEALFLVNGGRLVLDDGVSIVGAVGTGDGMYSGAVAVLGGTATLGPGISIADCGFATISGGGNGAGVYVGAGATLNFYGGSIVNCEASGNGGGIYLNKNARLNLKGEIEITGNRKYNKSVPNNIYAFNSSSVIKIVGAVSGSIGVQYASAIAGAYNKDGASFAGIKSSVSDSELAMIARGAASFKNDVYPELGAALADDQQSLVWTGDEQTPGLVPDNLIEYAYVRVTPPGGESTYYWTLADAFGAVKTDGTAVEMLRSDVLNGNAAVANGEVRLSSAPEGAVAEVSGGTISVSGSLAITNIVLSGGQLFNVNGGLLLIEDVVPREIGCVGGSSADPMLFAKVRCDMSYESLTNSAANFRNAELGAYGVAITNAADTAMVWSTAIAADGSFTDADGVIWGCVGDIPDNEVEIEVEPTPIAFKSIVLDAAAGEWNLTLTNLVRGCWYRLYATNSLAGGFAVGEGVSEPVTNFQAEVDGEFIFKVEDAGEAMFWKAVAEPGVLSE